MGFAWEYSTTCPPFSATQHHSWEMPDFKSFLTAEAKKRTGVLQEGIFKCSLVAHLGLKRNTVCTCRPLCGKRLLQNQCWRMSDISLLQPKACDTGRQRGGQAHTTSGGGTLTIKIIVGRTQPGRRVKEHKSTHTNTGRFRKFSCRSREQKRHKLGRGYATFCQVIAQERSIWIDKNTSRYQDQS